MTDIVLNPITSGYNLGKINANFATVQDVINNQVVHNIGGNNVMHQALDMNSFPILNASVDTTNPGSLLTVAAGDIRYYNITGDRLEGTMDVSSFPIVNLRVPIGDTEPVRKDMFDGEQAQRAAADASLQGQLNGTTPPIGTAFSPISWHGQVITNSINIPANQNAWSFGPTITIATGQVVTIGDGSFWTIANGATTGSGTLNPEIPTPLDFGVL